MSNHHDSYCDCRRCLRGSKKSRREVGRKIKKSIRLARKIRRDRSEQIRKLEASGLQVITL